nr:hypothetical protein [Tanacetum cinerariifolium]
EEKKDAKDPRNEDYEVLSTEETRVNQEKDANDIVYGCDDDPNMPNLKGIVYSDEDEDVGVEANMTNLDTNIHVSPIPTTRIHKDHPVKQIIGDIHLAPQTRRMTKNLTNYEPKKVIQALTDPTWIKAIQDELLQFKLQESLCLSTLGFEDPEFPNKVYKVEKALHGLHQAPRAWYETFSTYLLDNRFHRGQIDKILFIKRVKDEFYGRAYFTASDKKDDGIFISQDKYVDEILKKFGFSTVKTANTPIETSKPLLKDENAEDVDVHLYRLMIGSLMYLTSSRLDIIFADSPTNLKAYTDSDYAGGSLDRKSTTGGCQFLRSRLFLWQCKKQTVVANSTTEAELYTNDDWNELKQLLRMDFRLTLGDRVERATTTDASLDAEQDCGTSHEPPLLRVNTLRSGEESMQLMELMELCIKLSNRVLALENNKTAQDLEITHLKMRVKSLDDLEDYSKQGRKITEIDQDHGISLVQHDAKIQGRYDHDTEINTASTSITTASLNITIVEPITTVSAPITTAGVSVSTVEPSTPSTTTTTIIEDEDLIIAQTLMKMRSEKLKEKAKERGSREKSSETTTRPTRRVIMREANETTTRSTVLPQQKLDPKEKGKGKMAESKTIQTKTKLQQEQERLSFEADVRLQVELDKEERGYNQRKEKSTLKLNKQECLQSLSIREKSILLYKELDQGGSKRQNTGESSELGEEPRDKEADELEGNRHLHAGRKGVSIVKGNSYIDAGRKALGG